MNSPVENTDIQLLSKRKAAKVLGISRDSLNKLIDQGRVAAIPNASGKRQLVSIRELNEFQQREVQALGNHNVKRPEYSDTNDLFKKFMMEAF